jgi:hypothetical protein
MAGHPYLVALRGDMAVVIAVGADGAAAARGRITLGMWAD